MIQWIGMGIVLIVLLIFITRALFITDDFSIPGLDWLLSQLSQKTQSSQLVTDNSIVEKSEGAVLGTKESVQDSVQDTADEVNNFIEDTTNSVLSVVGLGEKKEGTKVEVKEVSKSEVDKTQKIIPVKYSYGEALKIKVPKGEKSYLQFSGIPENFCLFVDGQKYSLKNNNLLEITMSSFGNFPIKMDYCDENLKNVGEIIVE